MGWSSDMFICLLPVLLSFQVGVCQQNLSYEEQVVDMIISKMNTVQKNTRPVPPGGGTVAVEIQISLIHILDLHEASQLLTTMLWKSMRWTDHRITWNPDDYGGLEEIVLASNMIWTPDIVLYNSMDLMKHEDKSYHMVVYNNGLCNWIPAAVYESFCAVDMDNFPYDTQRCHLKFGPWVHSEDQINMTLSTTEPAINLATYTDSSEWELLKTIGERNSVTYECCLSAYTDVTFAFVLKRHSNFYTEFLILPIVLMGMCVMVIFWIPPTRPDRTSLGMSLFAVFMLLLLLLVQISPPAKNIKLITYCCVQIVMIAMASVLTTISLNINQKRGPVPKCMRKWTSSPVPPNDDQNTDDIESDNLTRKSKKPKQYFKLNSWPQMATLLDRICFVIYIILNIVFLCLYLPQPW